MSLLGLLAIALLIITNAYFVATEFALVAVRRTQIELWVKEERRGARAVAAAIEDLDDAIAATQLGITLASIALGFVGEPALARLIEPALHAIGAGFLEVHVVAVVLAFAIITFLHVVVGELAPKAIALDHPGRVALLCAKPLLIFGRVFRWLLWVMNGAGSLLVRAVGVEPPAHGAAVHSPEELSLLVSESRAAVLAIERGIESDELLDLLRGSGFTRLPVYDGSYDNVIGILHTKDLFQIFAKEGVVILEDALRPVNFIRSDLPVTDALREFRRGRRHLAVVRDDDGPVLGVCTLEDVLEEIVGEIEDEHDQPTPAGSD
jgi:CBS domain containing-hemolysin-like protein